MVMAMLQENPFNTYKKGNNLTQNATSFVETLMLNF